MGVFYSRETDELHAKSLHRWTCVDSWKKELCLYTVMLLQAREPRIHIHEYVDSNQLFDALLLNLMDKQE